MKVNQMGPDHPAGNEVLLDNPFQDRRIAGTVPGAFWIDDGDRTAFTDPEAVRLGPENPSLVGKAELLEPALEEFPGRQAPFLVAALWRGLIAAEEDVAACDRNADRPRDLSLRFSHG